MKRYSGKVTGTSKYGIFIEFDEIFTGLLHVSKMDDETKKRFKAGGYSPEDSIEFYVGEVTKDNRLILTEEDPQEKLKKMQEFIFNSKDKVLDGKVAAVMKFGVLVTVDDVTGLVPMREFRRKHVYAQNLVNGDQLRVKFNEYKDDKVVFALPN